MRTIAFAAAVVVLAVAMTSGFASAQCATVASNVFTAGDSGCPRAATCRQTSATCLAAATCATAGACLAEELRCLLAITAVRSNTSDPCSTLGNNLYIAQIAGAAATTLNATQLDASCRSHVCQRVNATANLRTCTGDLPAAVCTAANLLNATSGATVAATTVAAVPASTTPAGGVGGATTTASPRSSSAFGVAGMWAVAAAATVAALLA
jgi:hypothetical protein